MAAFISPASLSPFFTTSSLCCERRHSPRSFPSAPAVTHIARIRCSAEISPRRNGASGDDFPADEGMRINGLSYHPDELEWCTTEAAAETPPRPAAAQPRFPAPVRQRVDVAFVRTFRESSPYINAFSGRVFVLHVPGALVTEPLFGSIMEDIALMRIVGIKLVLVLGPSHQVEARLASEGLDSIFHAGRRVTDDRTLRLVTEASGNLQFEIESMLSRGVVNMPSNSKLSIVTSNFYTAKPLGVIEGCDYGLTGVVRKFDVETMTARLNEGDILILRNIAASPSGQLFNCQSEDVAGSCAAAIKAEKLIFLAGPESNAIHDKGVGKAIHYLTISTASRFLATHAGELPSQFNRVLETSVRALEGGVTRAHLLDRTIDGVLLMEVFHRDGVGLMISRDLYEGIRKAKISDVLGIEKIVQPLTEQGILVPRGRATIETDLQKFIVVERDGMVIACLSLSVMADDPAWAELGCLAVHESYRRLGKGDSMLNYTELLAFARGVRNLFILSTSSFQWFVERGFSEVSIDRLPVSRQKRYNSKRNSKIYFKKLESPQAVKVG